MENIVSMQNNIVTSKKEINEAVNRWGNIIKESFGYTDPIYKDRIEWMSVYAQTHKILEKNGQVDFGIIKESIWNWTHLNPGMNVQTAGPIKAPTNTSVMSPTGAGSGDTPITLLPIAMQVAAMTIGFDLVPVKQLKSPMGLLQYRDVVYGGGNVPVPGGADGRVAPLIVEIRGFKTGTGASAITESDLVPNAVFYGVADVGANAIGSGSGDTAVYFKFTFIGKSRITGNPIFKVETATEPTNPSTTFVIGYDNGHTLADIFGSSTTAGLVTSLTSFPGKSMAQTGAEPALVEALNNHIPGFSGRGLRLGNDVTSIDAYEREEAESTPTNSMGYRLFTKLVKVKDVKVNIPVTRQQIQDYKAFGFDILSDIESILVNETSQTINKDILDKLYRLGNLNAYQIEKTSNISLSLVVSNNSGGPGSVNVPTYWGVNKFPVGTDEHTQANTTGGRYYPGLGATITTSAPANFGSITAQSFIQPTAGDNVGTLQRLILSRILAASNLISVRGRRGPATFAVVSGMLATAIQNIAGFVPYPLSNTVSQNSGQLYPLGTVAGITIYVDQNLDFGDMTVLVGRKGDGASPGLIFCPYILADSVQTIAEQTMAPKVEMLSRYALVEAGFYPQLYYYTFKVLFDNLSLI